LAGATGSGHEQAWAEALAEEHAHQQELLATLRDELGTFARECAAALTALDTYAGLTGVADVLSGVLARYDGLFERQLPYMFWVHPGVHLHFHVVTPYRAEDAIRFVAAGELGSGVMFNPVTPESAGRLLRAAVSDSGSTIPGPSGCTRLGA